MCMFALKHLARKELTVMIIEYILKNLNYVDEASVFISSL